MKKRCEFAFAVATFWLVLSSFAHVAGGEDDGVEIESASEAAAPAGPASNDADANTPAADPADDPEDWEPPPKRMGDPKNAKRLEPENDVWIHRDRGVVIADGRVSLREGMLEMFACPKGTKEHESIVAVDGKAFLIHAALLNIGAEPKHPVRFAPKYEPAEGTKIHIDVVWVDEDGEKHTARAQDWVRDVATGKAMEHDWVFGGSDFWTDEFTGKRHYMAEGGELICVSNFSSAMLDLPIESSHSNDGLAFEAFTERVPPLGTHVRLVLMPQLDKRKPDIVAPARPPDASKSAE